MAIEFYIEPRKVYEWRDFCRKKQPYSIALDGLVKGKTRRNALDTPLGPYANFNHHEGVDRFSTRSTSDQVHLEINMGLFDTFRKEGIPTAQIYVNDCDQDTCLAIWLLQNHERVIDHAQPNINKLVYCVDRLDTTAGGYPFGDIKFRRVMEWIFEPYHDERYHGKLHKLDATEMRAFIEEVQGRIHTYVFEGPQERALLGAYETLSAGENWRFVRETGSGARAALMRDKVSAFVSLVEERPTGSRDYVLWRKSGWIRAFNNTSLYFLLNEVEEKLNHGIISNTNCWDGGDTVGGSPRDTGSFILPDALAKIINSASRK